MEHGTPMTEDTLVCEQPSDDVPPAADGADAPTNPTAAELTLGFALDTGCMLVFGHMAAPPPAAAKAGFADGGSSAAGDWRSFAWAPPAERQEGMTPFIAALAIEQVFRAQALPIELDVEDAGANIALPPVKRIEIDSGALVEQLARAGAPMARIFDFLKETLSAPAFGGSSPATIGSC